MALRGVYNFTRSDEDPVSKVGFIYVKFAMYFHFLFYTLLKNGIRNPNKIALKNVVTMKRLELNSIRQVRDQCRTSDRVGVAAISHC